MEAVVGLEAAAVAVPVEAEVVVAATVVAVAVVPAAEVVVAAEVVAEIAVIVAVVAEATVAGNFPQLHLKMVSMKTGKRVQRLPVFYLSRMNLQYRTLALEAHLTLLFSATHLSTSVPLE